jgi:GTP:adenosylcobinamide-phosphate guanylyltransferase
VEVLPLRHQAVLVAGDRGSAKAVRGRSKAFVEIAGKPMVVHVLETLLHTPEVSEVYLVGDPIRLEKAISEHGCLRLAASRSKPIHIVPQRNNLFENVWHAFLRALPASGPPDDHPIVVVPADVPVMVPEEVSSFVRQAAALDADYAIGLSPELALRAYAPRDGQPGIEMATFNLAEGRFRQNNLHFVRPLRMGNRHYIQEMYDHRYQKELGNMIRLGLRILRKEFRNLWVLYYYLLMHLAGVADRRGYRRAADWLRSRVPLARVERALSSLLRTRLRTVVTAYGGAAMDVDNDEDLAVVEKMLPAWKEMQARLTRVA